MGKQAVQRQLRRAVKWVRKVNSQEQFNHRDDTQIITLREVIVRLLESFAGMREHSPESCP